MTNDTPLDAPRDGWNDCPGCSVLTRQLAQAQAAFYGLVEKIGRDAEAAARAGKGGDEMYRDGGQGGSMPPPGQREFGGRA